MKAIPLMTADEARAEIVAAACHLLTTIEVDDPFVVNAMLWGAGAIDGLTRADRTLARRHRRILDSLIASGYAGEVVDELDGICSACELADGRFELGWLTDGRDG